MPDDMDPNLDLLREVLQRLDPTQPIKTAAHQRWYVERPDGIGTALARNLQVDPSSSHLIVGSIGCGKSTELLAAGRVLVATHGVFARYVEVSQVVALDAADGVTVGIAVADELAKHLIEKFPDDPTLAGIARELRPLVEGFHDFDWASPDDDAARGYVPPLVKRPLPNVPEPMLQYLQIFEDLAAVVRQRYRGASMVWLLDGLDRLSDPLEFDRIVEPFLHVLKAVGIGVAVVGPRRIVSGLDRLGAASVFDELHWMGPVEPTEGGPGWNFLNAVLQAREISGVVAIEQQNELVRLSGGAVRILLQLVREAIKETWVRNAPVLGSDQVQVAADRLGRSLLLGISDSELALLRVLFETGTFAPRSPEESALALTNRVLEYRAQSGLLRHAIHPTLIPFVSALSKSPKPDPSTSEAPTN